MRRVTASVMAIELPGGSWMSTSTSGRSEPGKNCLGTSTAMPKPAATSSAKVAATTPRRQRTIARTTARQAR